MVTGIGAAVAGSVPCAVAATPSEATGSWNLADEPGAVGEHQLDPLFIDQAAVLDRVDPGDNRVLDPLSPVGVSRDLTPGGAVALLIFFAFAMQCMSTIAVVRRETGGWKWPAIQFAYMTLLAYLAAFATNHLLQASTFLAAITK